jgi:ABC-type phosphonate transport system ATPase subunit
VTRSFTDQHQVCVGISVTEDDLSTASRERAAHALKRRRLHYREFATTNAGFAAHGCPSVTNETVSCGGSSRERVSAVGLVGNRAIENAAIRWVMSLETGVGRVPVDHRSNRTFPGDLAVRHASSRSKPSVGPRAAQTSGLRWPRSRGVRMSDRALTVDLGDRGETAAEL